jgi:hypothetical protein
MRLGNVRHTHHRGESTEEHQREDHESLHLTHLKSDPVSLDTVWTTMTAAKEAGHEGQGAEANHDSWQ